MSSQIAKDVSGQKVWQTQWQTDRQTEVNINRDSSLHPDLPNFIFFGGVSGGGGGGGQMKTINLAKENQENIISNKYLKFIHELKEHLK